MKFQPKFLIPALVLAFNAGSAFAASMISCNDADGELVIAVSPNGKLATFFDNDHYTAMRYVYSEELGNEIYEGRDLSDIRFSLNLETMKGKLIEGLDKRKQVRTSFACGKVKDAGFYDWNEVAKAIENAPKNSGSTRY